MTDWLTKCDAKGIQNWISKIKKKNHWQCALYMIHHYMIHHWQLHCTWYIPIRNIDDFRIPFASFLVSQSVILYFWPKGYLSAKKDIYLPKHHWWSTLYETIMKHLFCPAGRDNLKKSRPVPSRGKILSLSRCPFVPGQNKFPCPAVPLSRDKSNVSVPLSRGTRNFCPVGNTKFVSKSTFPEFSHLFISWLC